MTDHFPLVTIYEDEDWKIVQDKDPKTGEIKQSGQVHRMSDYNYSSSWRVEGRKIVLDRPKGIGKKVRALINARRIK